MVLSRDKKEFRQKLLERLMSLTENEIKRRSKNVEARLSSLSIYKSAKIIMVYYPLKGEVNILDLIRKDSRSKRFCFPVMDLKAKNLRIFQIEHLEDGFIPGPYGVMEPDTKKAKELTIEEIDLILVPGLGFDRMKNRLGRGAGFYDRFLQNIKPSIKRIGLAFDFQITANLPVDPVFDQALDSIVSEKEVL
ncbi:MAG: 5-formyltetrahydrofolate cyclo-ligase [Candidatus Omnitrophica bacterium]|nr:5-formyltetrahydrofolate cyclo-ligase [Candidatus Omnitrophota bacterium]